MKKVRQKSDRSVADRSKPRRGGKKEQGPAPVRPRIGKKRRKRNRLRRKHPDIVVRASALHGMGVFAARDIAEGTWIVQYVGPLVHEDDVKQMSSDSQRYLFYLDDDLSIDGSPQSNRARWINHRCSGNNCHTRGKTVDEHPFEEIWIVSKRNIRKGEELTYSYGDDYWNSRICRCGSEKCVSAAKSAADL